MKIEKEVLQSIKDALKETGHSAVRIEVKKFGWNGPVFGVVLDEQQNEDISFEEQGIKFVIEKDLDFLMKNIKDLEIGKTQNGFDVISKGCC